MVVKMLLTISSTQQAQQTYTNSRPHINWSTYFDSEQTKDLSRPMFKSPLQPIRGIFMQTNLMPWWQLMQPITMLCLSGTRNSNINAQIWPIRWLRGGVVRVLVVKLVRPRRHWQNSCAFFLIQSLTSCVAENRYVLVDLLLYWTDFVSKSQLCVYRRFCWRRQNVIIMHILPGKAY